jgi:hypothetical protein
MVSKVKDPNPNLRTNSWGPPTWFSLTCFLMGFPKENPTKKQQRTYKTFLNLVGDVLPCNICRDSYKKYIKELPMNDRVMSCRKNLVMWFFKIHNKVNKKLGCRVLTQPQLNKKYAYYEKFRAVKCSPDLGGCIKSAANIKVPKRTKVITFVDERALMLRAKDDKKKKSNNKK